MNNLQTILEEQGRSKAWLARQMEVTFVTVSNWCKDKGLNKWKLEAIARLLNVEPNEIKEDEKGR